VNPPFEQPDDHSNAGPESHSAEFGPQRVVRQVNPERQAIIDFRRRLFELTPRVLVTRGIVAVNLAVFAMMAFTTGEFLSPDSETLKAWGSNYGPLTLDQEWWRIFTSMFVHVGAIHVAFNMWILWDIGHLVERLVGNVGFLVLYLISGLCGSVASVCWNPQVNSAGASGAVFGVFGALLGYMLLRGDSVPKSILGRVRSSGLTFLAINLAIGFSIRWIDNAAHIGGLAAGFICGALMSHSLDRTTKTSRAMRNLLTAVLGATALLAALSFAPKKPADIAGIEEKVLDAYNAAVTLRQSSQITNLEFAKIVESDVLLPWREMRQQMDQTQRAPRGRQAKLREYVKAREEAFEALIVNLRDPNEEHQRDLEQKNAAVEAILKSLNSM